jgi:16S rRNA (cytidine1402-2'-O)-methyltransferase
MEMTAAGLDRSGTLFVVGTPIGNLDDLSPRAQAALESADIVAAEDTRRTRGLLSQFRPEVRIIAYHEHNETERIPELVEALRNGAKVSLVSDAGTPAISDPGMKLVRAARAAGIAVVPIPGPSAVLAALSACGLPTDRFVFEGFLPRRAGARSERLAALRRELRTIVFFEAVHRVQETLAALVEVFGGERQAAVARELTKIHEQIVSAPLAELAARLGGEIPLLGEFVVVVAGAAAETPPDEAEAERIFVLLRAEMEPRRALALTAAITGLPRNALYKLVRVE